MDWESLNPRQERFCLEYVLDLNATAAYKRAGYAAKGNAAEVAACRLLRKPKVRAAIRRLQEVRARRLEVRGDDILRELVAVAFRDIRDILAEVEGGVRVRPVDEWPAGISKAIESVRVRQAMEKHPDGSWQPMETLEFKLASKIKALHDLAQHKGLLKNLHDVAGKDGGPIEFADVTDEQLDSRIAELQARIHGFAGDPLAAAAKTGSEDSAAE